MQIDKIKSIELINKWYNRILDFRNKNPLEYKEMDVNVRLGKNSFDVQFPNKYRIECCYDEDLDRIYIGVYNLNYRCLLASIDELSRLHFRDTVSDKPVYIRKYAPKDREYWWVYDMLKVMCKFNILEEIKSWYQHTELKICF